MENTDKVICRDLVAILERHGVRKAFVSPGSRNAPLLVAIARSGAIDPTVVVDERCAAFMALGYGVISGEPIALVCTSGTALLNYAPAVAEAYYRQVPLIVISADRPMEWIDQDDSQTLRQHGALSNFVKASYDIPDTPGVSMEWYAARSFNDAMLRALNGRRAPVHINIQINEPIGRIVDCPKAAPKMINMITPREDLTVTESREIGQRIASPRRVMIVSGFMAPDRRLNAALGKLAQLPNVVVLTETVANLHGKYFIQAIDTVISEMTDREKVDLAPDVVITVGGALVSRFIKHYLRGLDNVEHWHVGLSHTTVDCFMALTQRIEMVPSVFFMQLASAMQPHRAACDYADRWLRLNDRATSTRQAYVAHAPWSDLKAFATLLPMLGNDVNLQLSNGTPVRYAQILAGFRHHRCDCNRGVSGIDGCTSTAAGAAMAYGGRPTLLITGDMSAQYDVGALAAASAIPDLRIVVIRNNGGGIFRFINSTAGLPERERFFAVGMNVPVRQLAEAYGFDYFEAADESGLRAVFRRFMDGAKGRPAILAIDTPANESAEVLKGFFSRTEKYRNKQ